MSGIKKKLLPAVHPAHTIANIAVKTSSTEIFSLSLMKRAPNQNKNAKVKKIKNCEKPYKIPIIIPFFKANFSGYTR